MRSGGHLVIMSFANDGPKQRGNLHACRSDTETMATELGEGLSLVSKARETYTAPPGSGQAFVYGVSKRI
jgi:hypothetical protein